MRANQAKMHYGSGGVGSAPHLACELLNAAIGVNTTHVPYRGGGPPMQRLDRQPDRLLLPTHYARNSADREQNSKGDRDLFEESPANPAKSGIGARAGSYQFRGLSWYAFFLPKGTPAPIVHKLQDATIATMATPAVQERLTDLGYTLVTPDRRSSEYLQKFVESEIEKWAGVIKAVGIAAQ